MSRALSLPPQPPAVCQPACNSRQPQPARSPHAAHSGSLHRRRLSPSRVAAAGVVAASPAEAPALPFTASASLAEVCLVEAAHTEAVGTAADLPAALALLATALERVSAAPPPAFGSAVLRYEVALPRDADALRWLRSLPPTPPLLPHVFFAPRAVPPAVGGGDQPGVSQTAPPACGPGDDCGQGATAGAGCARLWRGEVGCGFDAAAAARVRRFVGAGAPRARALGGSRFETSSAMSDEWAPFGAFCFVLPLLELSEGPSAATLALTLAWDDSLAAPVPSYETGHPSWAAALHAARAVLAAAAACPPAAADARVDAAPDDAASSDITAVPPPPLVAAVAHTPGALEWQSAVHSMLTRLSASAEAAEPQPLAPAAMEALARLAASNGGAAAQAALTGALSGAADGGAAWAALAAMATSASGRAALEELAGRSAGGGWGESPRQGPSQEAVDIAPVPLEALTGSASVREPVQDPVPSDDDEERYALRTDLLAGDLQPRAPLPASQPPDGALTKVVLARRTQVALRAPVAPLDLLAALRRRAPGAYAFALRPSAAAGTFLGCSPERLFALAHGEVATEAVAGTRGRAGGEAADAAAAYEMLTDAKEHAEQRIVQQWVRGALGTVCVPGSVGLVGPEKQVLRAGAVQHLYSRLQGTLLPGATEADLLHALHPTPAVCGAPRPAARAAIAATETFDRGFYAGPFGALGGGGADFCVAIRSALAAPTARQLALYAGVGVVAGANAGAEWRELDLKVGQFHAALTRAPAAAVAAAPNCNAAWAALLVEECVRCGVRLFCVAPGSRSTPLALAAARHPRAQLTVCIDERALAFHALGAARGGTLAAVVTSSGTAVANLLPAVVEAAESGTPLLLLTADRPPELREAGANQTIQQPGIFGTFARWAVDVPCPPEGPAAPGAARQLLTTVDAAVHRALAAPAGPVHLNLAFREPLAPTPAPWPRDALEGLRPWLTSGAPLTRYVTPTGAAGVTELMALLRGAKRGILVVGQLGGPADALAVAHLAARLGWPLVADACSGLRVRAQRDGRDVALLSHFDLALTEQPAWAELQPDVILQVGGRLVSKRVQAFLGWAAARGTAWAFLAPHPWRHDPAHTITLRLQAPIAAAAHALAAAAPAAAAEQAAYTAMLRRLDAVLRRTMDAHLAAAAEADGLSEMGVARALSRTLPEGQALFLGNSMPVRDMDVYADAAVDARSPAGAPVAASRGASGIDGVLSAASGFAAGLGAPATLLIGDVSFAHDSNGLLLLRDRAGQPPLTAVVINNGGGAIFSFLPLAGSLADPPVDLWAGNGTPQVAPPGVSAAEFEHLFATPPDVRLAELCAAHRLAHLRCSTPGGLARALAEAWRSRRHTVVEVALLRPGGAARNAAQHRAAEAAARLAVRSTLDLLRGPQEPCGSMAVASYQVVRYSLPLRCPLTTAAGAASERHGALLHVTLVCGARGVGDIAPLPGLHAETLDAAIAAAVLAASLLARSGMDLDPLVARLDGGFAAWLGAAGLGLRPESMPPSARFALESALLDALAVARGQSLAQLLCEAASSLPPQPVLLNALIPAGAGAAAAAAAAAAEGHSAFKVKVGRPGATPEEDAATCAAVRAAVGEAAEMRADANWAWTLAEAQAFGRAVAANGARLAYCEEPVAGGGAAALAALHAATGLCSALDETLDAQAAEMVGSSTEALITLPALPAFPSGCAAAVLKPGALGGLETAACLARRARARGARPVISSAFESSVGLAACASLAAMLDGSSAAGEPRTAHGLGTASWFLSDTLPPLLPRRMDGLAGLYMEPAQLQGGPRLRGEGPSEEEVTHRVTTPAGDAFALRVRTLAPAGLRTAPPAALLVHGFMGSAEDWEPLMAALVAATGRPIAAVDLPGHGGSQALSGSQGVPQVAAALAQLSATLCPSAPPLLLGYSLGARVALHLALMHPAAASGVVLVSGTPGLRGEAARSARAARDDALAASLLKGGAAAFATAWYRQRLFAPLAALPAFAAAEARRSATRDAAGLAAALAACSPGRAPPVWDQLAATPPARLVLVAGERDPKFAAAARRMAAIAAPGRPQLHVLPGCGHAPHHEAPQLLLPVLLAALGEK